jgi:hypothetical protein
VTNQSSYPEEDRERQRKEDDRRYEMERRGRKEKVYH